MITVFEGALKAFMTAQLAADASLAGIVYEVRAATQKGDLPDDRHTVICGVRSNPRQLRALKDFTVQVQVLSPADVAEVTAETHGLMERAIERAWEGDPAAAETAFNTAVMAAIPGWHSGGFYPGDWEPANEDNQWTPAYVIDTGIAVDGV